MIVSKVPFRVTFNGGGSDLPSFFSKQSGLCLTSTLNQYVYLTVKKSFDGRYRIAYSETESAEEIAGIAHPLVRNTLQRLNWLGPGLEITSIADIPSDGSGLGSSSAFTVALIRAISHLQDKILTEEEVAKLAIEIEIDLVGDPIGWQDQHAVTYGRTILQKFSSDRVKIEPIFDIVEEKLFMHEFNKHVLFFHIAKSRKAREILHKQNKLLNHGSLGFETTKLMVDLAEETLSAIRGRRWIDVGRLLSEGWKKKSTLNGDVDDEEIMNLQRIVNNSPCFGGKILGAGGGGFLMLLANPSRHLDIERRLSGYKRYKFQLRSQKPEIFELGDIHD